MDILTPLWGGLGPSTFLRAVFESPRCRAILCSLSIPMAPVGITLWGKFSVQNVCCGA